MPPVLRPAVVSASSRLLLSLVLALPAVSCSDPTVPVTRRVQIVPVGLLAVGESGVMKAVVRYDDGRMETDHAFSWTSDDPGVASVSAAGVVEGIGPGITTIRVAAAADLNGSLIQIVTAERRIAVLRPSAEEPDIWQHVDRVYSALDATQPVDSEHLNVPMGNDYALVVALNDRGDVMLAALADGPVVELGTESTALVLARTALNPQVGIAAMRNTVDAALRASGSYPALISYIRSLAEAGESALITPHAAELAHTVAGDARAALAESLAASRTPYSFDVMASGVLHYLIDGRPQFGQSLWIDDDPGDGMILHNDTRLAWEATSRAEDGEVITSVSLPPVPADFWALFRDAYSSGGMQLPGNGARFDIEIGQSTATRGTNSHQFLTSFAAGLVDASGLASRAVIEGCATQVGRNLLDEQLPEMPTQTTGEAVAEYISASFAAMVEDPSVLTGSIHHFCEGPLPATPDPMTVLTRAFIGFWLPSQRLDAAWSSAEVGSQMTGHWDASYAVTVCKHEGRFVPCAGGQ